VSSNRTGYALGRLDPVLYYENSRGYLILPPSTALAREGLERKNGAGVSYRDQGFELREAGTLAEVDRLQKRLVEQEMGKRQADADRDEQVSAENWRRVGSDLRQRMISAATTSYEREFIELYLQLREEKRAKHRQRFLETSMYLWLREMDSSRKVSDTIPSEPGDRWEDSWR
jgi:hypothetical protein